MLRKDEQLQEVTLVAGGTLAAAKEVFTLFAAHHLLAGADRLVAMATCRLLGPFKWQLDHIAAIFTRQFLVSAILRALLHGKQIRLEFQVHFVKLLVLLA